MLSNAVAPTPIAIGVEQSSFGSATYVETFRTPAPTARSVQLPTWIRKGSPVRAFSVRRELSPVGSPEPLLSSVAMQVAAHPVPLCRFRTVSNPVPSVSNW